VIELILNIAGFSLSNWVTYGFSFVPGPVAWRVPLAMQFIFIVILYATVPWLPESPRWLVAKGRDKEAEQVLADIEGTEIEDPYVQTELGEIKWASDYEKNHHVRIRDLVRGKQGSEGGTCALRRLFLGMGAQVRRMRQHLADSFANPANRGFVGYATTQRHQRHKLLPSDCTHRICWAHEQDGTPASRLQQRLVPAILTHRNSQRGTMGTSQDDDVCSSRPRFLLSHHHHPHPILREARLLWSEGGRFRERSLLLLILRLLRHWIPGCPLAVRVLVRECGGYVADQ